MSLLFIAVIAIAVLALLATLLKNNQGTTSGPEIAFDSQGELFSPAERSFLGVLEKALGDDYRVFGKVRLGDIVKPTRGLSNSQRQTALNKVNRKHLDLLVCRADDLSFVVAVELDDQSHQRKDRKSRDLFVDEALESARIRIVHIPAQKSYNLTEVRETVLPPRDGAVITTETPALTSLEPTTSEPVQPTDNCETEEQVVIKKPICPKCQSEMVKRQAKKGPNAGNWFWACSTFPKCRQVIAINDAV
jgi:Protein of unknown function (DUF2726)/Topoisomerase DNA binding C4 zinc finger